MGRSSKMVAKRDMTSQGPPEVSEVPPTALSKQQNLSKRGILVLSAFKGGEKLYGLQVIERTGLFSGTLYPLLQKLEDFGWLEHSFGETKPASGRPPRIYYRITPAGEAKLEQTSRELESELTELQERVRQLRQLKTLVHGA